LGSSFCLILSYYFFIAEELILVGCILTLNFDLF